MPRRKQGHSGHDRTTARKEEDREASCRPTGNTGGDMHSEGNVSQAEVSEDDGDDGSGVHLRRWDDRLAAAGTVERKYLHKKFKKMETMSGHEFGNVESSTETGEKPTNVSLEALFQVTGHELEKINKCSEMCSSHVSPRGGVSVDKDSVVATCGASRRVFSSPSEGGDDVEDSICAGDDGGRTRGAGRHSCPFCGLGCGKPSVLQKHIRAHTNERPYPCIPCGFAFKTKSNLYKHCKSRAHHLKASHDLGGGDGGVVRWLENGSRPPDTDDSSDSADAGCVGQSVDTGGVSERATPPSDCPANALARCDKTPAVASSPIYKPKFHVTNHNSSVSCSADPASADDDGSFRMRAFASRSSEGNCRVESSETAETSDVRYNLLQSVGRRDEQFRLRLDVSRSVPTANISSTSSPSLEGVSTSLPHCRSSNCSTQNTKSPKLASPEYLQQHITKLISQNAAIVDTLDPLWPRRYTRQSSIASSQNIDGELRSRERLRRLSEDVSFTVAPHLAKSKLACALLATTSGVFCSTAAEATAGLERRQVESGVAEDLTKVAVRDAGTGSSEKKETLFVKEAKDESIVKSLLTLSTATWPKTIKEKEGAPTVVDASGHPQNPEGSIIKDLLLKARTGGGGGCGFGAVPFSSDDPPSACERSPGGNVAVSRTSVPFQSPVTDDSSVASYVCSVCNIYFRSVENLEVHRSHYCRVQETRPTQSADCSLSGIDVGADQAPPVTPGNGASSIHKPRGRPKGSKNRPKFDSVAVSCGKVWRSKSMVDDGCEAVPCSPPFARGVILPESSNSIREILTSQSPGIACSQQTERRGAVDATDVSGPDVSFGCGMHSDVVNVIDGPILKKHLMSGVLSGDRSPPLKKRKFPVDVGITESVTCRADVVSSSTRASYTSFLKSLEHLSKNPMRTLTAGNLFGGEVQVCDGVLETRGSAADETVPSRQVDEEAECDPERSEDVVAAAAAVVATIAKPVHNSGGTVLQVHDASLPVSACIQVATVVRPLMATGCPSARGTFGDLSGAVLLSPPAVTTPSSFSIDISRLNLTSAALPLVSVGSSQFASTCMSPASVAEGVSGFAVGDSRLSSTEAKRTDERDGGLNVLCDGAMRKMERIFRSEVPTIAVYSPNSPSDKEADVATSLDSQTKHLTPSRPTSLPLRRVHSSMVGTTLVSPETPRPKKKYGQCYINGQYYTYLELKQSTKVYYCCIHRPQPMYVPQDTDPKLSMYSVWQTVNAKDDPCGITPVQALGLYDSRHRSSAYTTAVPVDMPLQTTHSSYWTYRQKTKRKETDGITSALDVGGETATEKLSASLDCISETEMCVDGDDAFSTSVSCEMMGIGRKDDVRGQQHVKSASSARGKEPKRVRIFEGGFKSNEDYTYVRGRGRGKYVCEECGIRCKKPSMLKKHIRTHTDVRPYTCKHCNFSFKTKGNLTKHMKSKAHHKKCVEMGVVPVPVAIDDVQIDEEALARQERIEHQRRQFANDEDSSQEEDDDDDEEEDDDEYEEEDDDGNEGYREGEDEDDESVEMEGQFDDAFGSDLGASTCDSASQKVASDQVAVAARSLLDLSRPSIFGGKHDDGDVVQCQSAVDDCKEVLGNSQVSWSSRHDEADAPSLANVSSCVVSLQPYVPVGKGASPRHASGATEASFSPYALNSLKRLLGERVCVSVDGSIRASSPEDVLSSNASCPTPPCDEAVDASTIDQPIDLSMPHFRSAGLEVGGVCGKLFPAHVSLRSEPVGEGGQVDLRCYENVSDVLPQPTPAATVCPPSSTDDCTGVQLSLVLQPNWHGADIRAETNVGENHLSSSVECIAAEARRVSTRSPSRHHLPFAGLPASPSTSAHSPTDPVCVENRVDCSRPLVQMGLPKMATYMQRPNEDGKCICSICSKTFSRPSQLRLHVNIHYFERPFRCDSCAISFRTKGHLQKHKRSVSHYNKVNMNLTFGTPTTDNPRPFKCADCKIAFRIHGHLAKHLRSKMHIMKLECLGKLPFGTYAEIERSGANLNEIDTTDCENSLESLQTMALKLVDKIPARQHWCRERTISGGSCDDQSDGVPYVESPGCGPESVHHGTSVSADDGGNVSPEFTAADRLVVWSRSALDSNVPSSPEFPSSISSDVKCKAPTAEGDVERQPVRSSGKLLVVVECDERTGDFRRLLGGGTYSTGSVVQNYEDISEEEEKEDGPAGSRANVSSLPHAEILRDVVGMTDAILPLASREDNSAVVRDSAWRSSGLLATELQSDINKCEMCGETCPTLHALNQHTLAHTQLRPFVCDHCDAGFTAVQHLEAHLHIHQPEGKAFLCRHCQQPFACNAELKCHLDSIHADGGQVR